MQNHSVELTNVLGDPVRRIPRLPVGRGYRPYRDPSITCVVGSDGDAEFAIDVYADTDEYSCFQEAVIWGHWSVIGFGHSVYFVDVATRDVRQYWLDSVTTACPYFGHLYTGEGFLLVASGSNLWRFDSEAALVWTTQDVGLDGVLVHDVGSGVIRGDGEWDPPGGWLSFRVDLDTGTILEPRHP